MKRQLFIISSIGFLLLAPAVHQTIYGVDESTQAPVQTSLLPEDQRKGILFHANTSLAASIWGQIKLNLKTSDPTIVLHTLRIQEVLSDDGKTGTGNIILLGQVGSQDIKDQIEKLAKGVSGVNGVTNKIEVVTPSGVTPAVK